HLPDVAPAADRLDDRNDHYVFVGLVDVLDEALPPAGGALGADAAAAVGGVVGKPYRFAQLLGRFHPRDDDPVRADVEGALNQPDVALRQTDQRNRFAAHGGAQVL